MNSTTGILFDLNPSPAHPRNSEGSFVTLQSGRIVTYYSQFGSGDQDEDSSEIAEIHTDDLGRTWSAPTVVVRRGQIPNLMSVSVLRLASGRIALFYCEKYSRLNCHPVRRVSADEGATWSEPVRVVPAPGYFVLNNDRVIQTGTGRLIVPVAFQRSRKDTDDSRDVGDGRAIALWYYSDDEGATWTETETWWTLPMASIAGMQEPGVVELADGSLYSWARTDQGTQWACRSQDGGRTWTPPAPTTLLSPISPASIKRLPGSSALLAVYNDHSGRFPFKPNPNLYISRTPLVVALSTDDGRTWPVRHAIEDNPRGFYCYTGIHYVGDDVWLAYGAGDEHVAIFNRMRIRRIALKALQPATPAA
ncbi:MAG: sialidase family protein [Opitutales bacterium]